MKNLIPEKKCKIYNRFTKDGEFKDEIGRENLFYIKDVVDFMNFHHNKKRIYNGE